MAANYFIFILNSQNNFNNDIKNIYKKNLKYFFRLKNST